MAQQNLPDNGDFKGFGCSCDPKPTAWMYMGGWHSDDCPMYFSAAKAEQRLGKYRVIYADPPWDLAAGPRSLHDPGERTRELPYPTMTVDEICALPVSDLAQDNAVLFLWTTNKYLEASYRVSRSWGFDPSTMLVWIKAPKGRGLGGTFGISTEFLLFSRRGSVAARERYPSTWFDSKRGAHSRKPGFARELIDRCFDGPKIELFAREAFLGWDAWGNQIISDVSLEESA